MVLKMFRGIIELDGVRVGHLYQDDNCRVWYVSPRQRATHYFRLYEGWGVAKEIIDYLVKIDAFGIKLSILGEKPIWVSLEVFKLNSMPVQYTGYEPQSILKEKFWNSLQTPLAITA